MAAESWMLRDLIEVLGWTLLHFVWQGIAAAVLLAALLLMLRRASAQARYLAACGVFALMAFAPLITSWWLSAPPRDLGTEFPPDARRVGRVIETHQPLATDVVGLDDSTHPTDEQSHAHRMASENVADGASVGSRTEAASATPSVLTNADRTLLERTKGLFERYLGGIVGAWLLGVAILSLRLFVGWCNVLRLRRRASLPASESWQALLRRLAERLRVGRSVKLVESALVEVPTVIGWLSPVILLPASAMIGLRPEQLEALLAHELAHVRRHDYLVNLLQTVIETLLFYHPVVWWVSYRIRIEREHCCDDIAVQVCGDRLTYVKALVALEELRVPQLGLAMSSNGGSLLTRVAHLLGQADQQRRPVGWVPGLFAFVLLTMAGALGAGLLTPPEKPIEGLPNDKTLVEELLSEGDLRRAPPRKLEDENGASTENVGRFVGRVRLKTEKALPDLEKVAVPPGKVLDESLVFSKDGGLANVFVYLWKPRFKIEMQASDDEPKPFVLIVKDGKFWPHASVVRVGRPIVFENQRPESVSFLISPNRNTAQNFVVASQKRLKLQAFTKAEPSPIQVKSDFDPWMLANVFPSDHPFVAVTDEDGRFAIEGLPPGEHEFRVWQERVGLLEKSYRVTIKPGDETRTDLEYAPHQLKLNEDEVLSWPQWLINDPRMPRPKVPRRAPDEKLKNDSSGESSDGAGRGSPDPAPNPTAGLHGSESELQRFEKSGEKNDKEDPSSEQRRVKIAPRDKTPISILIKPVPNSTPLRQRTVISGGVEISGSGGTASQFRIRSDRASIESEATKLTDFELSTIGPLEVEFVGNVQGEILTNNNGSIHLRAERVGIDLQKNRLRAEKVELWQKDGEKLDDIQASSIDFDISKSVITNDGAKKQSPDKLAVERGITFLTTQQQMNGTWHSAMHGDGVTALCTVTLLQAGVKPDDSAIQKALAFLRKVEPQLSYTVALQTMVFCAASPKQDAELIRRNVTWLEKAQVTEGKSRGSWSYGLNNGGRGDGSCSRFAMLGLHAAQKSGFDVQADTWRRAGEYWLTSQKPDGRWGYTLDAGPTPIMTLAGVAGLAIVNQHLPRDEQTKVRDAALRKPLEWLKETIPQLGQGSFGYYALHSLERAGHLSELDQFGDVDWKAVITKSLLDRQRGDGSWVGTGGNLSESEYIATSFALLFLTGRADAPKVGPNE